MQMDATRSLVQTPSLRMNFSEGLEYQGWRATVAASWEPSGSLLRLDLETRRTLGPARLQIGMGLEAALPGAISWGLHGSLQHEGVSLQVKQLRWQEEQLLLKGAEFTWTPDPVTTLKAQLDSSKDVPLKLKLERTLSEESQVNWTGRFSPTEDGRWLWEDMRLELTQEPFGTGVKVSPLGLQEFSLGGRQAIQEDSEASAAIRLGPAGEWLSTELGGAWHDPFSNSLQTSLTLSPEGWKAQAEGTWLDPNLSLHGNLAITPAGLSELMLLSRAMYDVALLDGLMKYSDRDWLMDLSGSVSQQDWQWSGSSSWTSRAGWEKASLSIGKEWRF